MSQLFKQNFFLTKNVQIIHVNNWTKMARRSAKNKKDAVVCINQAYKSYGNKQNPINVLNGLNLVVSKGSM